MSDERASRIVSDVDSNSGAYARLLEWRESARVLQVRLGRFEIGVTLRPHRMRRRWEIRRWSI